MIRYLHGDDIQIFIDVIDEVRSPLVSRREIWLIEDTFHRLGTGHPRPFAKDPNQVYRNFAQDLRSQYTHSEITSNPSPL